MFLRRTPSFRTTLGLLLLGCCLPAAARGEAPADKGADKAVAKTYCNPLPMPESQSLADPTVIQFEGKWYLYAGGSGAFSSPDLVNWTHHSVKLPGPMVGPTLERSGDFFYLAGNGAGHLMRGRHPLGPWEDLGPIKDARGKPVHWVDLCFFRDDDGTFYCYHNSGSGVGADGVYVTVLDPAKNYAQALGPSKHCFGYNPAHVWERWGDANEFPDVAWIEGPWMSKRNGRYYLSYSGCGTEWRRYAVGVYTSNSPTGPWTYDDRSPILHDRGGLLNGTGHHCLTIGPDGNWWIVYHVLVHQTHGFDRRLAIDPVSFDADGRMIVGGPTETPQPAPAASGAARRPAAGLLPLTINKPATASSSGPGRTPDYAVDNYIRTWWEPADDTLPQWLEVDLAGTFSVEAARIIFSNAGIGPRSESAPYRYKIEVSADKKVWRIAVDKSANNTPCNIEYEQFAPVRGRYVRLTITAAPRDRRLGVIEFTAFGRRE
jgi:hypothetical protein